LNDPSPFAWHHVICLAKDASDKAFDESLFLVLPEIATVPIMTFSTDGILKAMTPHWKSIRAVASAVLARQALGEYNDILVRKYPHMLSLNARSQHHRARGAKSAAVSGHIANTGSI
jgi:hypothetical protein